MSQTKKSTTKKKPTKKKSTVENVDGVPIMRATNSISEESAKKELQRIIDTLRIPAIRGAGIETLIAMLMTGELEFRDDALFLQLPPFSDVGEILIRPLTLGEMEDISVDFMDYLAGGVPESGMVREIIKVLVEDDTEGESIVKSIPGPSMITAFNVQRVFFYGR